MTGVHFFFPKCIDAHTMTVHKLITYSMSKTHITITTERHLLSTSEHPLVSVDKTAAHAAITSYYFNILFIKYLLCTLT